MSERLVKVERFKELRVGMLVVYTPCGDCGGRHRTMLLRRYAGPTVYGGPADGWLIEPQCSCTVEGETDCLDREAVARGAIFRVDDGMDPAFEKAEQLQQYREKAQTYGMTEREEAAMRRLLEEAMRS